MKYYVIYDLELGLAWGPYSTRESARADARYFDYKVIILPASSSEEAVAKARKLGPRCMGLVV